MAVGFSNTNKPINPRGLDASPKGYNRAALYSGKALDFDGVNDNIQVSAFSTTGSTRSLSYFFKASASGNKRVFEIRSGSIFFNSTILDGKINTFDGVNGINTTKTFNDNKWHHVVITHNGNNNAAIYVDGVSQELDASTFSVHDITNQTLYIGGLSGVYYDGGLSNLRLFNVALTAAQVSDLYNNPEKIVPTGVEDTALKLWLPMMEGAGTTAYDGSGNGNHGTISGATYVNGVGAPVAQSAVIDWNKGTNKAQYSEQFDNAYWGIVDTETPTANDTTAPDGQTTADKIVPSTNNGNHYIWNTTISLTGQNTISVFAKYNGYNIGIRPQGIGSGQAFANFDLQNGTILGSGGTYYDDSSITSFGDGWYRISMTMDVVSTYGINFYAVNGTTATELPTFTADGTSGFYLWGAQVNAGATLTPYVRTGATAQTSPVLLPQGLTSGRDITGVNLFENVRKQGALNLDGNSWAEVHDNASLDVSVGMTMECWVYINDITTGGRLISKWGATQPNRSYQMFMNNALVRSLIGDGTTQAATQTTTSLSVGNWYHIAVTYNKTNLKTYLNGVEDDSQNVTFTIYDSNEPVYLGRYVSSSFESVNPIAQPRIYNRALTAEEVLRNYNSEKNTYQ